MPLFFWKGVSDMRFSRYFPLVLLTKVLFPLAAFKQRSILQDFSFMKVIGTQLLN